MLASAQAATREEASFISLDGTVINTLVFRPIDHGDAGGPSNRRPEHAKPSLRVGPVFDMVKPGLPEQVVHAFQCVFV